MPLLNPSFPAGSGFLMACLESLPGKYAGDSNLKGFAVHRDVAFNETSSVYFPDELQNTLARNTHHALGLDNFDMRWSKDFYPEMDPMFFGMAIVGAVSPSSGTLETYKAAAATAAAAGSVSATLQPTKGQKLKVTVVTTGANAIVSGAKLQVFGTDLNGASIVETIFAAPYTQAISTTATFVTSQGFASIIPSGIVWSGMPTDTTIAVASQTPQTRTYTGGAGAPFLSTCSFVHFDGGATREYVFGCCAQLGLAGALTGPVTLDMTGYADPLNSLTDPSPDANATTAGPNGNPDLTTILAGTLGTSPITYVQPSLDVQEMSWQANVYIDEPGGSMGATQYGDVESWRWTAATGLSRLNTMVNSRLFGKTKRGKRSHAFDLTVDFATLQEWQRARTATKRYVQLSLLGQAITNTINRSVIIRVPLVYTAFPISGAGDNTQLQLTGQGEFDTGLGYDLQVMVTNTVTGAGGTDAYLAQAHS